MPPTMTNIDIDNLVKLLGQLGIKSLNNLAHNHIQGTHATTLGTLSTPFAQATHPVAYHTSVSPPGFVQPTRIYAMTIPPGFIQQPAQPIVQSGPFIYPQLGPMLINPQAQPTSQTCQPVDASAQATSLPHAFTTGPLYDPDAWNMDTGASSHLNSSVTSLNTVFNTCMYPSISVGDGHSIPITNTGHSILPTPTKFLHLNNVLITPHIVKNLISVRQFVRDNNCTIEFDAFGFSVKDFLTRRVLLRCDSTGDLYPVIAPSPIPHVFLISQHTWHQRLGHPGGEMLRRLVSSNFISYNKEKPPVLYHACQLGKHVRLPFVSSSTVISSYFDIIHSDV
ncbi:ribonuclease H-like domain-containing protein [Tanacetum coccineum]